MRPADPAERLAQARAHAFKIKRGLRAGARSAFAALLVLLYGWMGVAGDHDDECDSFRECISMAALQSASSGALAARMYERATQLRPDSKEAWLGRGALAQDAGDLDDAGRHLLRALVLDPHCWRVGMNMGNLAARQGDLPTALRAFQHVIRTNPFVPQAFYSRGFVQLLQGRLGSSCASMQRAWKLKPDLHTIPEFRFALEGLQSLRSAMNASRGIDSFNVMPCPIPNIDAEGHGGALASGTGDSKHVDLGHIASVWEQGYMQGSGSTECAATAIDIAAIYPGQGGIASHTSMDIAREFVGRIHALYGPDCAGFVTVHMVLAAGSLQPRHLAEINLWDLVKVHNVTWLQGDGAGDRQGRGQVEWAGRTWLQSIHDMQATRALPQELVIVDMRAVFSSAGGRAALQVDAPAP